MGSCYTVTMGVKFKSKQKAVRELQDFIGSGVSKWNGGEIDFSLDKHRNDGVGTDTWDDMVKVFFAHWKGQEVQFGEWRKNGKANKLYKRDKKGFSVYNNGFTASYGWESVMLEMFERISPYLKNGSWMNIDCDDGVDEVIVKNGKFKQVK